MHLNLLTLLWFGIAYFFPLARLNKYFKVTLAVKDLKAGRSLFLEGSLYGAYKRKRAYDRHESVHHFINYKKKDILQKYFYWFLLCGY